MQETIDTISVNRIDGTPSRLAEFAGDVLLIVNVASECGLTPQYEALERLYETYHDRGFEVLAFPSNDFGAQEPGSNAEIATFCRTSFGVRFPMFEKITVKGDGRHPLYAALIEAKPAATGAAANATPEISWNFEKFVVAKNGEVVARFAPTVVPDDPQIVKTIEAELTR